MLLTTGNNTEFEFRASGAYIFRPLEQEPVSCTIQHTEFYEGPLYWEIHWTYDNNVSLVSRLPPDYIETEWLVGPISVEDGIGKEFVVQWIAIEVPRTLRHSANSQLVE